MAAKSLENPENCIEIFTDGACQGNPGPGGWGAILRYGSHEKELWGGELQTTNNRMELMAPIQALTALTKKLPVRLYTDSQYVKKGITEWIKTWKKQNWQGSHKKQVKNLDLWQKLDQLNQQHQVTWHWVKGHSGHPENERADELARKGLEELGLGRKFSKEDA